jgi:hypothetical protein
VFQTVYKKCPLDLREYPGAARFEKDSGPVIRINTNRGRGVDTETRHHQKPFGESTEGI